MRDERPSSWQGHSCFAKFLGSKRAYEFSKYLSHQII
jgi:hypothetical protein